VTDTGDGLVGAVIVDVDGTLALIGDRHRYASTGFGSDRPNPVVVAVARALSAAGKAIIVVSGRPEIARAETVAWLDCHLGVPFVGPLMRGNGDNRPDQVVKKEMFEGAIAPNYQVLCVLDDRDRTVEMWRGLGLTCLQVAPGGF